MSTCRVWFGPKTYSDSWLSRRSGRASFKISITHHLGIPLIQQQNRFDTGSINKRLKLIHIHSTTRIIIDCYKTGTVSHGEFRDLLNARSQHWIRICQMGQDSFILHGRSQFIGGGWPSSPFSALRGEKTSLLYLVLGCVHAALPLPHFVLGNGNQSSRCVFVNYEWMEITYIWTRYKLIKWMF